MQSNILALSDSKIQMLKKLGIQLSVSMDGPSNLPNAMRKRAEVTHKTYKRLIEAGLQPGVLMTINHSNFNYFSEICYWLENELAERGFKANVVSSVGRGLYFPDLSSEQIFQSFHDILEYMIETKGQGVVEDNLSLELERFFASPLERENMPRTLCRDQRCGAGDRVIGVTPNGDLLPCGRFQWDDHEYFLGSLKEVPTHDIETSFHQAVSRFHSLVPETWDNCASCEAQKVCSYGCQAFIVRSKSKANVDCIPTKMRYQFYVENRDRLKPVIEAIREYNENLVTMGYTDGGRDKGYEDYDDRGYKDYTDKNYTDKYDDYRDRNEYYDYKDKKDIVMVNSGQPEIYSNNKYLNEG